MLLNNYDMRTDLFIDWIVESTPSGGTALEIGANDGRVAQVARIAAHTSLLAGVDPDRSMLEKNALVQERYYATLEDADIPAASFDFLFAMFTFEHVADPEKFIKAAARILKPGGSIFFLTPNKRHYFARISSILQSLGLQDRILGLLRGKAEVESYHYPAVYLLNQPSDVERIGNKYGFDRYEYRYCENLHEIAAYFPGPTTIIPRTWHKLAAVTKADSMLLNLMGRMTKAN